MLTKNNPCPSGPFLIDYHLHTCRSRDGSGSVEEHCKKAVSRGLVEICFTNHQEWISAVQGYFDYAMRDTGWLDLISEIDAAKKKFPKLTIKLGCEIGHYRQYTNEIIQFTKQYPFDYIIGSIHALDDESLDTALRHARMDRSLVDTWIKKYFLAIKEMVDHAYFDCIGHLDLAKKHMPARAIVKNKDLIWDIAQAMKENDIGFELNTSGWRQSIKDCYPSLAILTILKDAGIRKVTIGSDSHTPITVGQDIQRGLKILRQAGFDSVCTFSRRVPTYNPLPA